MAASNPGDKIFGWKLIGIMFTTCRIRISGLALNLRLMGWPYSTVTPIEKNHNFWNKFNYFVLLLAMK